MRLTPARLSRQTQLAVEASRQLAVVTDEQQCAAHGDCLGEQQIEKSLRAITVQGRGRLIGQNQGRAPDQGPGGRHALLLTDAELIGPATTIRGQIHRREQRLGSLNHIARAAGPRGRKTDRASHIGASHPARAAD
jgi:hypothetical protein